MSRQYLVVVKTNRLGVQKEDVDVRSAEPLQTRVERGDELLATGSPGRQVAVHRVVGIGCDNDIISMALDQPSENSFSFAMSRFPGGRSLNGQLAFSDRTPAYVWQRPG